jgi:hypothetical protein
MNMNPDRNEDQELTGPQLTQEPTPPVPTVLITPVSSAPLTRGAQHDSNKGIIGPDSNQPEIQT